MHVVAWKLLVLLSPHGSVIFLWTNWKKRKKTTTLDAVCLHAVQTIDTLVTILFISVHLSQQELVCSWWYSICLLSEERKHSPSSSPLCLHFKLLPLVLLPQDSWNAVNFKSVDGASCVHGSSAAVGDWHVRGAGTPFFRYVRELLKLPFAALEPNSTSTTLQADHTHGHFLLLL